MARPVKTLTHDGEDWQAILTGGCTCREDYTIGVLFLAKTTNREAFGRLRGIPPEHFDQPRQINSERPLSPRSPATTSNESPRQSRGHSSVIRSTRLDGVANVAPTVVGHRVGGRSAPEPPMGPARVLLFLLPSGCVRRWTH